MNADETTLKQAARRLVRESRAAQGLPAKVVRRWSPAWLLTKTGKPTPRFRMQTLREHGRQHDPEPRREESAAALVQLGDGSLPI
jgi:hypothetical protein